MDSFAAVADWGPRAEHPERCACRLARFLERLGNLREEWRTWYAPSDSSDRVLIGRREDALVQHLEPHRNDTTGEVIRELGVLFSAWNEESEGQGGLRVLCGSTSRAVTNHVDLRWRVAEEDDPASDGAEILRLLASEWSPDWGTVLPWHELNTAAERRRRPLGDIVYVGVNHRDLSISESAVHPVSPSHGGSLLFVSSLSRKDLRSLKRAIDDFTAR